MGDYHIAQNGGVLTLIQTYPQLIDFNSRVYDYFEEQHNLCGYNLTLNYPEKGYYPPFTPYQPPSSNIVGDRDSLLKISRLIRSRDMNELSHLFERRISSDDVPIPPLTGEIGERWGCLLLNVLIEWATNYTMPWGISHFSPSNMC